MADQFSSLGSNLLFVAPGRFDGGGASGLDTIDPLTLQDLTALDDPALLTNVRSVAGEFSRSADADRDQRSARPSVSGVTPSFPDVRNWLAVEGSFFTQDDFDERARVAVLGQSVYEELFDPGEYPIDQTVSLNNLAFRVIGVMEEKGGGPGGDQDNAIFYSADYRARSSL